MSTNITVRLRDLVLEKDPLYVGGGSHRKYYQHPHSQKQSFTTTAEREKVLSRSHHTPKSNETSENSKSQEPRHHIPPPPPPSQGLLPVPEDPHRLRVSLVQSRDRHKLRYEKLQRKARRRSAELKIEKRYQQAALLDCLDYRKRFQRRVSEEREQRDRTRSETKEHHETLPPLPPPNVRLREHHHHNQAPRIPSPSKLHDPHRVEDDKDGRHHSRRNENGGEGSNVTNGENVGLKKNDVEQEEELGPLKRHPSISPPSVKEGTVNSDREPNMTSLITTQPLFDSPYKYGRGTYMGVSCHVRNYGDDRPIARRFVSGGTCK